MNVTRIAPPPAPAPPPVYNLEVTQTELNRIATLSFRHEVIIPGSDTLYVKLMRGATCAIVGQPVEKGVATDFSKGPQ